MQGKYYSTKIRPTIAASKQHAAFTAEDILFDWTAVQVPKGTVRLISATAIIRPKGDANVTPNKFPLDLWFADDDRVATPAINGAYGSNTGVPQRDLIGSVEMPLSGYRVMGTNDSISLCVSGPNATEHDSLYLSAAKDLVITPKATLDVNLDGTNTDAGYTTFYMAAIAKDAFDFTSLLQINDSDINSTTPTTIVTTGTGMDVREHFAVDDVIHAHDDILLGTVASLTDATDFVITSATSGAGDATTVAHSDYLYNINPIEIILAFEY